MRPLHANPNSPNPPPAKFVEPADAPPLFSPGVDLIAPQNWAAKSRKPDMVDDVFGFWLRGDGALGVIPAPLPLTIPLGLCGFEFGLLEFDLFAVDLLG